MKLQQRIAAGFLAATLALSLAACGGGGNTPTSPSSKPASSSSTSSSSSSSSIIRNENEIWWKCRSDGSLYGWESGGKQPSGDLEIPSEVNGIKVAEIDSSAFSKNMDITSVHIPSSVKTVGNGAFSGCTNLKKVVMDDGVEEISYNAFLGCTSLKEVDFPATLTFIGSLAFDGCSMETVIIPENINGLEVSIDHCAFQYCAELNFLYVPHSVKNLSNVFIGVSSAYPIKYVFYAGTEEEWTAMENNEYRIGKKSTIFYNVSLSEVDEKIAELKRTEEENAVTISVSANPSSYGTVSGAGRYYQGEVVTVEATPNPSYYFLRWMEDNKLVSTDSSYTFIADTSHNLTAYFGVIDTVAIDVANFPDATFRNYISNNFDRNSDGELSTNEIRLARVIDVRNRYAVTSLKGVEYFANLTMLVCSNNKLTNLDISKNTALTYLDCHGNDLTSLDVSKNTELETLWCYANSLTNLDVSRNSALKELRCSKSVTVTGANSAVRIDLR